MPGMSTGLSTNNPTIVSAFYDELLRQGVVVAVILLLVGLVWSLTRSGAAPPCRRSSDGPKGKHGVLRSRTLGARLVRVSFGLLWIFDGILQGQASMPLGMAPQVIEPAAAASPGWVQHLDNAMATIWSYHPVTAPAAAVWIQVGLGGLAAGRFKRDLVTPRRPGQRGLGHDRMDFGEAFGGIFAPGLTFLFGAPGAVLLYCVAGALVALPEGAWEMPRLGRWVLRVTGAFWVGMALLQAWPGRGFWQGQTGRRAIPRDADEHGPGHGRDPSASLAFVLGPCPCQVRRRSRMGSEPLFRRRDGVVGGLLLTALPKLAFYASVAANGPVSRRLGPYRRTSVSSEGSAPTPTA